MIDHNENNMNTDLINEVIQIIEDNQYVPYIFIDLNLEAVYDIFGNDFTKHNKYEAKIHNDSEIISFTFNFGDYLTNVVVERCDETILKCEVLYVNEDF